MTRLIAAMMLVGLFLNGCAFGGYARADLQKTSPGFTEATTKAQIVEMLGPPDKYIQIENVEYLDYKTKKGWFVILFGQTRARDYEIKLIDGHFSSARYFPAGSSFGLLSPQGAVAE